ncbi:MAG: small multi-drug export protein [Lachnospiraceae bacterium]|nr:small multi-drug export protein [Lachnospiraceae bacterium]
MESLLNTLMAWLQGLPPSLIVFLVSMVPLIELRGGLIAAALLRMPVWEGVLWCLLGNMIPVPLILLFITPLFNWMKTTKLFRPMVEKMEQRSLGKSEKIQKYEFWGLVLFVGIPLPGTGAWTGSLIAALLGIRFRKALPAVYLGLLVATAIMCVISYLIPYLISLAG